MIETEIRGGVGIAVLNRPKALNALTLEMVRDLTAALLRWRDDPDVLAVFVHGAGDKALCAGGDIRFFHTAALSGDPRLDDFFTEEYALNHLIHVYPKPCLAWMDGVVMGGGMGISQGATLRLVTERSRLAMPETLIGLFPDVGGGWFLGRCPGAVGEYLALTGQVVGAGDAIAWGLADGFVPGARRQALLSAITDGTSASGADICRAARALCGPAPEPALAARHDAIGHHFGQADVPSILRSLAADDDPWARDTLAALRQRSPLMLCVVLEQVRRARRLSLAEELRVERGLVRRCFTLRPGTAGETVEGIRALAVDKDHAPRWHPARVEDVTPEMVQAFFESPWPAHAHPLASLG